MKVTIDHKSGFCFGVVNAIDKAEDTLQTEDKLYCLGDIVHNGMEVNRLEELGLITIDRDQFLTLKNCKVLLRAHGEPPSTYEYARENNIELIDATCPVVLKLQERVKKAHQDMTKQDGQILLFGKKGHAEVVGLSGQANDKAIVIEDESDLVKIDPDKPAYLFSQTTKSIDQFHSLAKQIQNRSGHTVNVKDTICRQVANRVPRMKEFSLEHELVVFVGGKKSSNARFLYEVCKETNPRSFFVSSKDEIGADWFKNISSVGVCGATSTPQWLMDQVADLIRQFKA